MLVYIDLLSGAQVCSDSYPTETVANGAIMSVESKKVEEGGENFDIGANASKGDGEDAPTEDEAVDDQKVTVINIVAAHDLQSMKISKKEYTLFIKDYYKKLIKKMNEAKYQILFDDADYKVPDDKAEAKAAEEEAEGNLDDSQKAELKAAKARIASFKKNFDNIQNFVKDEILKSFDDFDFYMPKDSEFGSSMLIPARYVGQALAPTFFYFVDGLKEEKF